MEQKYILIILLTAIFVNACQSPSLQNTSRNDFKYLEIDISGLQEGYKNGSWTIKDVVTAFLDRIQQIDQDSPALNSVITVNPEAFHIAEMLDKEMSEGKIRGPLHGIPVLLKDNIDTRDKMPTTCGSRALKDSYPLKDSYVAQKLREAGAVIIGKTNLSEWANFRGELSISGWSGAGGQTKNPYDPDRNPCGSSSGSGTAISANLAMIAIGTETDGSIVCPSHATGIVGIKPTVGLVSRSGIIPISCTQDTPGPMARTVKDAAICLGVLTGVDTTDEKTWASRGKYHSDYTQFLNKDGLKGKRIGIYNTSKGINYKVDQLLMQAVEFMKEKGAEVIVVEKISEDHDLSNFEFEVLLYEFKDGLNKYFQTLGPDAPVKNIEELIAFNKSDKVELHYFNQAYLEMASNKGPLTEKAYTDALGNMLKGIREEGIDRVMNELDLDAIVAPTGSPAWLTDPVNGDSFSFGSSSPAAMAGYPNITVPMGFIDNLPVGISFFGRAWSEPVLFEIAFAYEQGTRHRKAPEF